MYFKLMHLVGFAVPIMKNQVVVAVLSIFLLEYRCFTAKKKENVQEIRQATVATNRII